MAQLISTSVAAGPQKGAYPQMLNITQQFDAPVYVTEDFAVEFGGTVDPLQPGGMFVKPIQYIPTQLNYQVVISPFSRGSLGILRYSGSIADIFGNQVDLMIGNDAAIYNTDLYPYLLNGPLVTGWGNVIPGTAIYPNNTNPGFQLRLGPYPRATQIPPNSYAEGNFYLWVNYTWLPDRESEGIPFVWQPPFYYSWSVYGELLLDTYQPIPPIDSVNARYNICSGGNSTEWDTSFVAQYPKWRGKIQVWCFCSDIFAEDSVPWQYPAVASPTGDLSPQNVFGFQGSNIPLQWYAEQPFVYIAPNP